MLITQQCDLTRHVSLDVCPAFHVLIRVQRQPTDDAAKATSLPNLAFHRLWYRRSIFSHREENPILQLPTFLLNSRPEAYGVSLVRIANV
jgi:hypothetical protein